MDVINLDIVISGKIKKILIILSIGLLVFNYIMYVMRNYIKMQKLNWLKLLSGTIIFVFIGILSLKTKNYFLIAVLLFSVNLYNIELKDFMKLALYVITGVTIFVVLLWTLNILPDAYNMTLYGQVRHSLGFKGSLFLPNNLVYIAACYYSVHADFTKSNYALFQLLALIVFMICGSKNAVITMELFFLLLFVFRFKEGTKSHWDLRKKKWIYAMGLLSYPFMGAFSWILMQGYRKGNSLVRYFDTLITGRIGWATGNMWASHFKFINWSDYEEFTKSLKYAYDNGYYYLIARYGYLFFFIFLFITMILVVYMKNSDNYTAIISFSVLAVLNFIDNGFISYGFFPYLIMGVHCLMASLENKKINKKERSKSIFIKRSMI